MTESTVSRDSTARFIAEAFGVAMGVVSGVITARWLGPSGKGFFAALIFIAGLLVQLANMGLGEAAIVWIGSRPSDNNSNVVSSTLTVGLLLGSLSAAVLWAVGSLVLDPTTEAERWAVVLAAIAIPIAVLANATSHLLNAFQRIFATSAIFMATTAGTTIGVALLVIAIPLSVRGAVLGTALGSLLGLLLAGIQLRRQGFRLSPRWDWLYLNAALRYGLVIQAGSLLVAMAARLDLLFVFQIAGQEEAGIYSVALTIGALALIPAISLSHAIFPRLSRLAPTDATDLLIRTGRYTAALTIVSSSLLALLAPWAIRILFGEEFQGAIWPTIGLLAGANVWALQWLLTRGAAARGAPGVLARSFLVSLVVMGTGDILLIPTYGLVGAAIAAALGHAAGLTDYFVSMRGRPENPGLTSLVPRLSDFRDLITRVIPMAQEFTRAVTGLARGRSR